MHKALAAWAIWIVVLVEGCCLSTRTIGATDGAVDGDDGGAAPLAAADLCPRLADGFCAASIACCSSRVSPWSTLAECVASIRYLCDTQIQPALTDPRTRYNPDLGGAYLEAARAAWSACATPGDSASGFSFFDGTVGVGGRCDPMGGRDIAAFYSCLRGLVCDWTTLTCQPPSPLGEPCPCESGLACDAGVCQAPLADGAMCGGPPGFTANCQSGFCDLNCYTCRAPTVDDAYCYPRGGLCR